MVILKNHEFNYVINKKDYVLERFEVVERYYNGGKDWDLSNEFNDKEKLQLISEEIQVFGESLLSPHIDHIRNKSRFEFFYQIVDNLKKFETYYLKELKQFDSLV